MTAYLLNLADLFITLYVLSKGVTELNPPMHSVPFMVFYKVIVIGLLCWWLSKRPEKVALIGLSLYTVYYGVVCVYHIINIAAMVAA